VQKFELKLLILLREGNGKTLNLGKSGGSCLMDWLGQVSSSNHWNIYSLLYESKRVTTYIGTEIRVYASKIVNTNKIEM
jgi:hypothetical protein